MALLGVLLGITIALIGWVINEVIDHRKLIIDLQNKLVESRKPDVTPVAVPVAEDPKPKHIRMRAWNEDAVIPEVTK